MVFEDFRYTDRIETGDVAARAFSAPSAIESSTAATCCGSTTREGDPSRFMRGIYSGGVSSKAELRRALEARRRALSPEEVAAASRAVLTEVQRIVDWTHTGSVHVYRSVAEWGELDTSGLVAWLTREWPNVEVVQPTLSKEQPFPERHFDVILIPAVGFDRDGNRLGLGGGWYDRFVARQPRAQKIGVAYAWACVDEGIPVEPWDMKLNCVVTG